jgi:large subunit ribosomal protein L10
VENPRPEKVAVVTEVREKLSAAEAALVTEYRGLNVAALKSLRAQLLESGGELKIYKNTLVRIAARELGLDVDDLLTGPTAITFVGTKADGTPGDAVGVAKALKKYSTENDKLIIRGGVLGSKTLSAADVSALSSMPPREVLLAQLAGVLSAPMRDFATVLTAVPRSFVYALQALLDQRGGVPASADAADDEPSSDEADDSSTTAEPAEDTTTAEPAEDTTTASADDTTAAESAADSTES